MGRPKSFDPDIVLEKAMNLFHKQGFHSTSTAQLIEHVGINKFSLYAEFGSNKELFNLSLARFYKIRFEENFGFLEGPNVGIDEIRMLFASYPKYAKDEKNINGCFLTNSTIEFGAEDPESNKILNSFLKRVPKAFKSALDNSLRTKELNPKTDTKSASDFLASMVLGLAVQIRGKASQSQIRSTCEGALVYLDSLQS